MTGGHPKEEGRHRPGPRVPPIPPCSLRPTLSIPSVQVGGRGHDPTPPPPTDCEAHQGQPPLTLIKSRIIPTFLHLRSTSYLSTSTHPICHPHPDAHEDGYWIRGHDSPIDPRDCIPLRRGTRGSSDLHRPPSLHRPCPERCHESAGLRSLSRIGCTCLRSDPSHIHPRFHRLRTWAIPKMLIDGEKYACEACVRGHRVSNCNHYGEKDPLEQSLAQTANGDQSDRSPISTRKAARSRSARTAGACARPAPRT
jgi:Copper fist DNA binding domain